ncbi:MAG: lamin tail domain-containing protein [Bacteroidota bacterium]|nr:lamin tail domain-containing protein [Bacteroidota bacterium]
MRNCFLLTFLLCTQYAIGQIGSFPYSQGFENAFTTGNNVEFITDWTGNEVSTSSRIFQGSDARSGSSSLHIIPTSTFSGEVLITLDLTGISNPKVTFYAYSKQNGASSTRPVLLSFSTSIDGGNNYLDNTSIGDENTFPNNNLTSYTAYEYELPTAANGENNVIVRITASRGDGSGSAAELVMDDFTIEEQVLPLAISNTTAIDANTVEVTFNQPVEQVTAETVGNYAIDNGVSVTTASRSSSQVVRLTTSGMVNNNYTLTVNGVEDEATNTAANNLQSSFSYVVPLAIESISVVDKNTLLVDFNLNVEQTTAETLSNYGLDNAMGNPSSAVRNSVSNDLVTLTFSTDLADASYTLTVDNVTDESTLATASNLTGTFSYLNLAVESVTVNSSTSITIDFNQNLNTLSAENTTNYSVNFGRGNPTSVVQSITDASIVTLTVSPGLVNNTYEITINNVANAAGNSVATNLTANASFQTPTSTRQIVINEIYADPSGANAPSPVVLPSGSSEEFVELFNTSSEAIDLTGFELSGGTIGNHVLNGGDYVILTSSSNVASFQPFGNVVAVSSWNALTNTGEALVLRDNLGNLVDSLTYDLTWYRDNNKADGGWSLEQINPERPCSDVENWNSSISAQGGTPGTINSVFDNTPDNSAPGIVNVLANSNQEIVVLFDEFIDPASVSGATFGLNHGAAVSSATQNLPYGRSITLSLSPAMNSGNIFTLTVNGLTDCAGNAVVNGTFDFLFDNEAPVLSRLVYKTPQQIDLIFDEQLNESIAETETNFSINQGIGNPSQATLNNTQRNRVSLTFGTTLTEGDSYTLSYQNLADTLGNTITNSNEVFGFVNQIDTVIVVSSQLLDVYFEADLNEPAAETVGNYLVNRSIGNPISAALDNSNPRLVHLVFDSSFPENTTTEISFENIQNSGLAYLQLFNTPFVYDTDDPDIDSVVVVDQNTLQVYFDEILDETSAETINNYSANNGIGTPAQAILQPGGTSVVLNFAVDFEQEVKNVLTLTAIEDLAGNAISTNRNFDFTFDRLPPRLVGVELLSPVVLAVEFSEEVVKAVAENVNNYSVNNGIGNPIQAVRTEKNTSIVELTFSNLGNNASNTLTISNISDLFNNDLPTNLTASFSTLLPEFGRFIVLSDTSIQIQFTKPLTKASAERISNYGFDRGLGPFSLVQSSTDASIVTLYLTTRLEENLNYRLVINNLQDLDGNTVPPTTFDFTYNDLITQVSLINANTLEVLFEVDVDETLAETSTNYSLNKGISNPLTAVRSSTNSKRVTLFFDKALTESATYQLTIQRIRDIYGDVVPASRTTLLYDVTPPAISAVNSTYNNEIDVIFNEPLDRATATSLNHYSLNNGVGQPVSIRLSTDATTVTLRFANSLVDGLNYTLTVDRVEDLQGKAIAASTFDFTFSSPISPAFRDLVINEIYFDTHFTSGIPNYEFIELYNRGTEAIELRDFAITDKRDTAYLTSYVLQPNAYLTVSTQAGKVSLQNFGPAMGVNRFPSLSNTGETIVFLDRDKNVVDSLSYTKAFYNDNTKSSGGYTVELINPNKPCFDQTNYAASVHPNKGTPGVQNSVYDTTPDTTPPLLQSVSVVSGTQLRLTFNESMNLASLIPANFTLEDGITVSSITLENTFGSQILLNLSAPFQTGISRTITLSNIQDCTGNTLSTQGTFIKGSTPEANELLVTEIMATPAPSNGLPVREYFEIYNNSSEVMDLGQVIFKDDNGTYRLSSFNLQPAEYIIITSNSGATDLAVYGHVLGVNSFPTLTEKDRIRLENIHNELIFEVEYDKTYYQNDSKDDGGFSIEMINLAPACFDKANWIVTNSSVGGTPGAQNSVYDNSPDTTAPTITQFTVVSSTTFDIQFSESMNVATLVPANFTFSGGLSLSSITQTEKFGRKIRLTLSTAFATGTPYTLSVNNLSDCAGNTMPQQILQFSRGATPSPGQLIITEIMANPTPAQGLPEVEYLEILNVSNQILSLTGVILADATNSTLLGNMNISPGEYVLLAPSSTASQLNGYGKVLPVTNWPNLNNTADRPTLYTPGGVEIHQVNYNSSWYRSSTKANGGYSLEMIDPDFPCLEGANWIASDNPNGGTPGALNSVDGDNPDLTGPSLLQAVAVTKSVVQLTFSEKLESSTVALDRFSADNGLSFISAQLDETKRIVTLVTATDLADNSLYTITADNITDCTGNLIQANGKSATLIIPAKAEPLDIIVNEVLFNPVTGGHRFVEFYNRSNKYINLRGWKIAGLTNTRVITDKDLFIHPGSYFVVTSNGANIKSQYPSADESTFIEISSMPSLPTNEGTVFIYNLNNLQIDHFAYSEDYHSPLLDDVDGVSLERILFSGGSNDKNNWFSASSTENYATPGYENSQARTPQNQIGAVRVDPPTFAPDVAGAKNFTTLNYAFDTPGNTLNIRIIDAEGRIVKRLTQNTIVGKEGFFTWDGTTEDGGKARVGYYMVLMEVISAEGKISYIRDKVAIGSRL